MAQVNTGTTNFNQTVQTLINKRLEELLRAPLIHLMPGNFRPATFVKGTNSTMRFINIADLAVTAGTPTPGTLPWLTEGSPPTTEDLAIGYEEFSANQAGRIISLTDVAMMESPFELIATAADRVARNAIATADRRVAEVLVTGTNVIYAGSASSSATILPGNILTGQLVKLAVARLKSQSVPTFPDGTYHAIVHPGATYDLESDTTVGGWIDAQRYAGSAALFTGEVGRYAGVRFAESAYAEIKANTVSTALTTGAIDITTGLWHSVAHGLVPGDRVKFVSGTTGVGLVNGTTYFVVADSLTADTFRVSTSLNGTPGLPAVTTAYTAFVADRVVNVNSTFIFGPEAYAFGDWGTIETHLTPPGGHSDPLYQSALVGWKGFFGAVIMGEGANATGVTLPRYIRIESANDVNP